MSESLAKKEAPRNRAGENSRGINASKRRFERSALFKRWKKL
jgi:hypothetical protein